MVDTAREFGIIEVSRRNTGFLFSRSSSHNRILVSTRGSRIDLLYRDKSRDRLDNGTIGFDLRAACALTRGKETQ